MRTPQWGEGMSAKRLSRCGLLTAAALVLYVVELHLPDLTPIPGVKLGLANTVTLAALYLWGAGDGALVLGARILLGALFSSNPAALIYSAVGGALSYGACCLTRGFFGEKNLWAAGALGGLVHNAGQLLCAVLITGTPSLLLYGPVLAFSGLLAGAFTGLIAQYTVKTLSKKSKKP